MNYTQDELKELQAIHSLKESELGTRMPTEQEFQAFNATIQELWEKGFVVSKDNFLKLWLAFDANPNIPITRNAILESTRVYRDHYAWKSTAEMEFRKLSEQIGPETTELVIKQLGRHGLVNTPGTEDMYSNFSAVVRFYQSQGWQISANSFELAVGKLRSSMGHASLVYRPTPSQQAAAKRWENTRAKSQTKTGRQIAEEKAANVRHVMTPDGRRLSDVIMEEFYDSHPEALETTTPGHTSPPSPEDAYDSYWERQTKEYIQTIESGNIRLEAEQNYGHKLHNSWRTTYQLLDRWYEKRAPGRPQRIPLGSVLVEEKQVR